MSETPESYLAKLIAHPALTYLPPGWTEDDYQNMTPEQQTALPQEQSRKINQRGLVEMNIGTVQHLIDINAKRAARGAPPRPLRPEVVQNLDVEETPAESPVDPSVVDNGYIIDCVLEMEDLALDDYGFNVLRAYHGDDPLWEAFQEGLHEKMQRGIAGAPAECAEAMQRLDDSVLMSTSEHPAYDGKSPADVAEAFRSSFAEPGGPENVTPDEGAPMDDERQWSSEMGLGMATSICLMVDRPSMESIRGDASYVIAVDARLRAGQDLGYAGHFKVAIDALMPRLYAALNRYEMVDIAAAVDADGIWRGMGSFDADREFKFIEKLIT